MNTCTPLDANTGVAEILRALANSSQYNKDATIPMFARENSASQFMCIVIDRAVASGEITKEQASLCMRSIISFIGESHTMHTFLQGLNLTPYQLYNNWNSRYTLLNHAVEQRSHESNEHAG